MVSVFLYLTKLFVVLLILLYHLPLQLNCMQNSRLYLTSISNGYMYYTTKVCYYNPLKKYRIQYPLQCPITHVILCKQFVIQKSNLKLTRHFIKVAVFRAEFHLNSWDICIYMSVLILSIHISLPHF